LLTFAVFSPSFPRRRESRGVAWGNFTLDIPFSVLKFNQIALNLKMSARPSMSSLYFGIWGYFEEQLKRFL